MKNTFYLGLLIVHIFIFQSCDNTIDIGLPTDQLNTENVFKDKRSATSALSSLYINLRESSMYSGSLQGLGTQLGLYTDELEDLTAIPSSDYTMLYNNSLDPTKNIISSIWNTSYSHIYTINSFINGVTNSNGISDNYKKTFLAEAYILRSIYYLNLVQLYGDVPYTTSTNYKDNISINKTNTIKLLEYLERDIQQAHENLSNTYRSENKFYPNKAVAELLLAKLYLLQKRYDQAELFAKKIIDNPLYKLEDDISKVFKKNAKSTLWQLSNSGPNVQTYEARNYIMLVKDWPYRLTSSLLNSFDNNDLRKTHWIGRFNTTNSYYTFKYQNQYPNNLDECSVLFRLEEVYFILIESLIYQQKTMEVVPYFNIIRHRANLSNIPDDLNQNELILLMLDESKKEFFTEHGRRFFDLKRNNKLSLLKLVKPNWQDKHALLPYPEKEILINPNLNPQNEY